MLSACLEPDANSSPNIAKYTNSSLEKIFPNNSFAPKAAPAALAALEPKPLPGFIFLLIVTSKPMF